MEFTKYMIQYTILASSDVHEKISELYKESPGYGIEILLEILRKKFNVIDLQYDKDLNRILYFNSEKDLTLFLLLI